MSWPRRILRDPLVHFLAVGGLLFAAYILVRGPQATATDDTTIAIDRSKLLTFLQYESVAFEPNYFGAQFDALPDSKRSALISRYVREEALYREAKAMGLAEGDYVIRRRMIEKMLYLIDDTATESFTPTETELNAYYLDHRNRYEVAPSLTFTHVFIDSEIKRPEDAENTAVKMKQELNAKDAAFNDAPAYGDRFPYLQNYVDRDPDFIRHQFGAEFTSAVTKLAPSDRDWQGPIKSNFGYHLVLLTRHKPAYLPRLAEVEDEVRADLLRDTVAAYRDRAIDDLVSRFNVKLSGSLLSAGKDPTSEPERIARSSE